MQIITEKNRPKPKWLITEIYEMKPSRQRNQLDKKTWKNLLIMENKMELHQIQIYWKYTAEIIC